MNKLQFCLFDFDAIFAGWDRTRTSTRSRRVFLSYVVWKARDRELRRSDRIEEIFWRSIERHPETFLGEEEREYVWKFSFCPENLFSFVVQFPFWTFDKFWQIYLDCVREKFAPSKTTTVRTDLMCMYCFSFVTWSYRGIKYKAFAHAVTWQMNKHKTRHTHIHRHKLNNSHVHFRNVTDVHDNTRRKKSLLRRFSIQCTKSTQLFGYPNDSTRHTEYSPRTKKFLKFNCFITRARARHRRA